MVTRWKRIVNLLGGYCPQTVSKAGSKLLHRLSASVKRQTSLYGKGFYSKKKR
ncbi:hypothetical protein HMPREF1981_00886 [Bacteroides pyogenes F0041]|uniref:Uncharacterized protein n=1 Tax=Bacteroides pyogenes F0041 TaxID=1321819 RepID=U2E2H5_9BACE|nr:hypothetical protein HMPREF1981_00886 [Bacteroides pyogenes F0041]